MHQRFWIAGPIAMFGALALAVASAFLITRQRSALTDDIETTIRLRAAE